MCLGLNKLALKDEVKMDTEKPIRQVYLFVGVLCHLTPNPNTEGYMGSCFKTLLCLISLPRILFL